MDAGGWGEGGRGREREFYMKKISYQIMAQSYITLLGSRLGACLRQVNGVSACK